MSIPQILRIIYCELVPTSLRIRLRAPRDLEERLKQHQLWLEKKGGRPLRLRHADLRGCDFSHFALDKVVLFDCDLRAATFAERPFTNVIGPEPDIESRPQSPASIANADLRYSRLDGALLAPMRHRGGPELGSDVSGTMLVGATGLFGPAKAHTGRGLRWAPSAPPAVQMWGSRSTWGDFPSWETMKLLGTLPIISVSNIVFVGILIYVASAKWWNHQVDAIHTAASSMSSDSITILAAKIRRAPAPAHMATLLLTFVGLTAANLAYRIGCPTIVQEMSRYNFQRAHSEQGEDLEYLAATYSKRILRVVTFFVMCVCGYQAISYVVDRVIDAIYFFYGKH